MQPEDLKRWRTMLGLSQKDAAHALGLKRRVIQYYEKGERDGDAIEIPRTVRLACYALAQGIRDYNGPETVEGPDNAPAETVSVVADPADEVAADMAAQAAGGPSVAPSDNGAVKVPSKPAGKAKPAKKAKLEKTKPEKAKAAKKSAKPAEAPVDGGAA
jgi:transcriptional regulator with XRE-family HTH domain